MEDLVGMGALVNGQFAGIFELQSAPWKLTNKRSVTSVVVQVLLQIFRKVELLVTQVALVLLRPVGDDVPLEVELGGEALVAPLALVLLLFGLPKDHCD